MSYLFYLVGNISINHSFSLHRSILHKKVYQRKVEEDNPLIILTALEFLLKMSSDLINIYLEPTIERTDEFPNYQIKL